MNALQIRQMALESNADFGMNILDLPLEKQKELAKQQNLTWEQWAKDTKETSSAKSTIIKVKSKEEADKLGYELPLWHGEPLPFY